MKVKIVGLFSVEAKSIHEFFVVVGVVFIVGSLFTGRIVLDALGDTMLQTAQLENEYQQYSKNNLEVALGLLADQAALSGTTLDTSVFYKSKEAIVEQAGRSVPQLVNFVNAVPFERRASVFFVQQDTWKSPKITFHLSKRQIYCRHTVTVVSRSINIGDLFKCFFCQRELVYLCMG